MKLPLAWVKTIDTKRRDRRQWVAGDDAAEAREMATDLRERVLDFKEETAAQGIAFATDRDAWDEFRKRHPRAHMQFAGSSADDAIAEYAFGQFKRIWGSGRRKVHFQGDGTVRAPTVFTVGHIAEDEDGRKVRLTARTDVLEALKLRDPEDRALALAEIEQERQRLETNIRGREKRLEYLDMVINALKNGSIAIENPHTGEIFVPAQLPGQGTLLEAPTWEDEHGSGAE